MPREREPLTEVYGKAVKTLPRAYGGNLFENGVCRQGASEAITTTFTNIHCQQNVTIL